MRIYRSALGAFVLAALLAAAPAPRVEDTLAKAQELLDQGDPDAARKLLDTAVKADHPDALLLLLRSTALIQQGDTDAGRKDLERAVELDPKLRQGWLNLAGVHLVGKRYDDAYAALLKAQALDPGALDNELNLGAVQLLQGKLQPASERFQKYLQTNGASANAYYLVATNYALSGYGALAIENLKSAIALDERARLRARLDANFNDLAKSAPFQQILATDGYKLPPGAYVARQGFPIGYDARGGKLLNAVLDGLRAAGMTFDANVEVTDGWALLWGEMRIKVMPGDPGQGVVELSAPAESMTPQQWHERSDKLFRQILIHLPR